MKAADAELLAFIGATGSGKTLLVKKWLRARPAGQPLLCWSPYEHRDHYAPEFGERVKADPLELAGIARAGGNAVYVPRRDDADLLERQFAFFCGLALDVGGVAVLVEEMSLVATSRSAPARWRELVTGGRGEHLSILATTQRPQLCDSSLLDNATEIYCGRLNKGGSKKIMADAMDVPLERVRGLAALQFIYWKAGVDQTELVAVELPAKRARQRREPK